MVEDIGANQGILITNKGYTKGAINKAFNGNPRIELDVINFDELSETQGLGAIPYIGNFGVFTIAPFGWIVDLKEQPGHFPIMYQRGSTAKKAYTTPELIYFDIIELPTNDPSTYPIDSLIQVFQKNIESKVPGATFTVKPFEQCDGNVSKIKVTRLDNSELPHIEVIGFINLETHIFVCVLLTPEQLLIRNQRKLEMLLSTIKIAELVFQNEDRIAAEIRALASTMTDDERAGAHYRLSRLYNQMRNFEQAFSHLKQAVAFAPDNYDYFKSVIKHAIVHNNLPDALHYSEPFFALAPKNPRLIQDLMSMFGLYGHIERLVELLEKLRSNQTDDEVLGNITFHLGSILMTEGKEEEARNHYRTALIHFEKALPPDHYVIKSLKEHKL